MNELKKKMKEKDKIILKIKAKLQDTHRIIYLTENIRDIENSKKKNQEGEI